MKFLFVEGAVEKYRHAATPDGHSLDNTVKIRPKIPDPKNKIKLIQRDDFWPEKDEMSNAYMEQCTGDYIWQVDVDEFYNPEDIEKVRSFLIANPDITRVDIQTINFWRGFQAVMQGASDSASVPISSEGSSSSSRATAFKPTGRRRSWIPAERSAAIRG